MLVDALLVAEPIMHFANYVTNPERYLRLTDSVVELIQMSDDKVSSASLFFFRLGSIVFRPLKKHRRSWIASP